MNRARKKNMVKQTILILYCFVFLFLKGEILKESVSESWFELRHIING